MRKKTLYKSLALSLLLLYMLPLLMQAQGDSTKSKRESLIYLQYHLKNNQVPYLKIQTKNKTADGFTPARDILVSIYLDSDQSKDALVATVATDQSGTAIVGIPPALASKWDHHPSHTFYAHAAASSAFDSSSKEVSITMARLKLDTVTTAEGKSVAVQLQKNEGGNWVPMPEVDVKVGVKRYGGILNIGDDATYATDSSGKFQAEFAKANLPGDNQGSLELIAVVDDNEEVGTLETSMAVPWGIVPQYKSDFGTRSLWATPRRAPIWLMLMAYGCIIAVWSMIIYLITRIILIKKLGTKPSA